jgi:hypothetical protein
VSYARDAALAARLWREEVSRAEVPEEQPTEPPDPVVFGPVLPIFLAKAMD